MPLSYFNIIKKSVENIMTAMKNGKLTLGELEFIQKFFTEAEKATARTIERVKGVKGSLPELKQ